MHWVLDKPALGQSAAGRPVLCACCLHACLGLLVLLSASHVCPACNIQFDQISLHYLMWWLAVHVVLLHCRELLIASTFCALAQDEEGKILLTFPEPMKGFRDFLYFDEQLQMSIGNRGSLTIIQQEA